MKLSIRLQNHGCKNHPYWWIVVAPNRKNLRGRFVEHVGFWSPRHGVTLQRQIVLNVPRIKYWISCGAVPSARIQKICSIWNILPKPWFQQRTPEQLAAKLKPESEWTDKDKMKAERKRKRREREKLSALNYLPRESKYKGLQYCQYHKYRIKLREKIYAAERENQILRQLLMHNQFNKINRINQLSGNLNLSDTKQMKRLEQQLAKAKAQLALLDRNFANKDVLVKIRAMRDINELVNKIRQAEKSHQPFRKRGPIYQKEGQQITKEVLDRKLEYELIKKKLDKMNEDFLHLDSLHEPITLDDYANHLMVTEQLQPDIALELAQEIYMERGKAQVEPLTKFDIYFERDMFDELDEPGDSPVPHDKQIDRKVFYTDRRPIRTYNDKGEIISEEARKPDYGILGGQIRPRSQNPYFDKFKTPLEKKNDQQLQEINRVLNKVEQSKILPYIMTRPDVLIPTNRPVHPFPDFTTYVPEEYYEPITHINLNIAPISSIQPKVQLERYKQKRKYGDTLPNPSNKDKKQKLSVKRVDHIL